MKIWKFCYIIYIIICIESNILHTRTAQVNTDVMTIGQYEIALITRVIDSQLVAILSITARTWTRVAPKKLHMNSLHTIIQQSVLFDTFLATARINRNLFTQCRFKNCLTSISGGQYKVARVSGTIHSVMLPTCISI